MKDEFIRLVQDEGVADPSQGPGAARLVQRATPTGGDDNTDLQVMTRLSIRLYFPLKCFGAQRYQTPGRGFQSGLTPNFTWSDWLTALRDAETTDRPRATLFSVFLDYRYITFP
jgi:hypothetical protein